MTSSKPASVASMFGVPRTASMCMLDHGGTPIAKWISGQHDGHFDHVNTCAVQRRM